MIYLLVLLIASLAAASILVLSLLFLYGYYKNHNDNFPAFTPNVCVIVPCKEKEYRLEQNLEAICLQLYPTFSVIFVVDSENDSAYPTVVRVSQKNKLSKIVFTENIQACSGKISALLTGIQNTGGADVYVFADSDISPHNNWLKHLVSFLSNENIGMTTGFRWFFPTTWKSSLISTWNMAAISALYHPISTYAWGGSTAIRADLFRRLDVESKWKKGFSDDLILTETVKNAGYIIKFVPKCISESPSDVTMKKFLWWGTQQFTWMRWYNPVLWVLSSIAIILINIFSVAGFILIAMGYSTLGLFMVSLLFLEMMYGLIGIVTLKRLIGYPKEKFRCSWRYALLMPAVFYLYGYNSLVSSVKKQIVWGGRAYLKKEAFKEQ